jgi:hypothetical protein
MLIKFWILGATPDPKPTWGDYCAKKFTDVFRIELCKLGVLKTSCCLRIRHIYFGETTGIVVRNFTKSFLDLKLCSGSMGVFQKPWGCILCVAAYCRICIQLHMI